VSWDGKGGITKHFIKGWTQQRKRVRMTLGQKQRLFVKMVGRLIDFAYSKGYELSLGHALRCQDCKIGSENSLHKIRLAVDFNLFKDGVYLTKTEDHLPLGLFWESLDPQCSWGGRFKNPDGNHYSIEHNGKK
jgi:hypothetical protein